MSCQYCGSNMFTADYVQAQAMLANSSGEIVQDEIGYNECVSCGKWSKYVATKDGDYHEAIDNPEQRPSI